LSENPEENRKLVIKKFFPEETLLLEDYTFFCALMQQNHSSEAWD